MPHAAPCELQANTRASYPSRCSRSRIRGRILPFSAIYIELHYIFASMWGHRVYTLFGILFISLTLLTLVSSFITIAMTYFQLAIEDHRWWWRSLISGGSTGLFIYAYCFHYYQMSGMTGAIQTAFFFGYMGIMAYGFFTSFRFYWLLQ